MRPETIEEGQLILLYADHKKWLIEAHHRQFHTHKGIVDLSEVIGKSYGLKIKSSLDIEFHILKPTIQDLIMNLKRPTQIIYPKDIGLIIVKLDIGPGKKVLEIGTGSAATTLAMASLIKPKGHIYSYEKRKAFKKIAEKNVVLAGLSEYITLKNRDATEGLDESQVDAVLIDIGDPWTVMENVTQVLKPGHPMASFSPTINQVEKTVEAITDKGYVDIETVECLVRKWNVKPGRIRPHTIMTGHTGYITFARKTI